MQQINKDTQSGNCAAALTLESVDLKEAKGYGMLLEFTVATPAAKTFGSGTAAEVTDITCIADAGENEVQTLTFQSKASSTAGDHVIVEDTHGIRKWAVSVNKSGSDAEPTGALWLAIPSNFKAHVDISGATSAADVAALMETAFNSLQDFTTQITTDDTAADGTMTLTQVYLGPVTNPVPKNAAESGAGGIGGVQTTAGVASNLQNTYFSIYSADENIENVFWFNVDSQGEAPTVSGAVINAVAISSGAADTAVASALDAVIDALAAFSTSTTGAQVTVTAASYWNTTNASDSGSTGFTIVTTTPGVNNDFSIASEEIGIASHGYATGLKVAASTDTTLPTGLSATNYYVIKVDANTIKLASSAANALAGTAVNITGNGAGTHTLTPAAISTASYALHGSLDDVTYIALGVGNNITATGSFLHEKVDPMFNYVRVVFAAAAGQFAYVVNTLVRGN